MYFTNCSKIVLHNNESIVTNIAKVITLRKHKLLDGTDLWL